MAKYHCCNNEVTPSFKGVKGNVIKLRGKGLVLRAESPIYFSPMASVASPWVREGVVISCGLKAQVRLNLHFQCVQEWLPI